MENSHTIEARSGQQAAERRCAEPAAVTWPQPGMQAEGLPQYAREQQTERIRRELGWGLQFTPRGNRAN